jgi:hypothetical protein
MRHPACLGSIRGPYPWATVWEIGLIEHLLKPVSHHE